MLIKEDFNCGLGKEKRIIATINEELKITENQLRLKNLCQKESLKAFNTLFVKKPKGRLIWNHSTSKAAKKL